MLFQPLPAGQFSPVDLVNPYIGTGGGGTAYGGTMPVVTAPFGMTNWTAQTRQNRVSATSYAYEDQKISGFIGTHQPTIWTGDYGYVTLTPEINTIEVAPEKRALTFSHRDEITTPYYYSVLLNAGNSKQIRAEFTATPHCALFRFTYPPSALGEVVIEATRPGIPGSIEIDSSAQEISGYNPDRMDSNLGPLRLPSFRGYFVIRFDRPFAHFGIYHGSSLQGNKLSTVGDNVGAFSIFGLGSNEAPAIVQAKIGTSFISVDQARANLQKEIPAWSFDEVRQQLKDTWNRKLGIATVEGASNDDLKIFYTALYHAMLCPKLFSEQGRYYSAFDGLVHEGESYTAFSLWDTFRAENSFITLFCPERVSAMVNALLQNFKEGGWMPKWPNPAYTNIMIATHADSVLAEAINKGFNGFDYRTAYNAAYKDAMTPPYGDERRRWEDRDPFTPYEARAGLTYSKKLGFVPVDKTDEAASSSLEEAYDDWCVAQIAKANEETAAYLFFLRRSLNYTLLFNRQTGFMQGRNSDGSWADPKAGWAEGDKWSYTWAVLHDVPGLVNLMGGRKAFNAKLDEHFRGKHNDHANEPSHHYAYLYDYSGAASKTQAQVREIARHSYANSIDGIEGNEDCGQMSAWYIFAALGF